jgi:hypothetical protein
MTQAEINAHSKEEVGLVDRRIPRYGIGYWASLKANNIPWRFETYQAPLLCEILFHFLRRVKINYKTVIGIQTHPPGGAALVATPISVASYHKYCFASSLRA